MLARARLASVQKSLCSGRYFSAQSDDFVEGFVHNLFSEGNDINTNYSLNEDGVVPVGDAFRNGRLPLLTMRLTEKVVGGKVNASHIKYFGNSKLREAGDSISHDEFEELMLAQETFLSTDKALFVEDAGYGAAATYRNGGRIITSDAATALLYRNLLIPIPPRTVDHRASQHGWNLDERWCYKSQVWNGTHYDNDTMQHTMLRGQRPIIGYVGGDHDTLAVQFVQRDKVIVGAKVIIGSKVPIRGAINALGHAACVLGNVDFDAIALPSLSTTKGNASTAIINAPDNLVSSALAAKSLHGAYHNIFSEKGVSALWNGVITAAPATYEGDVPVVVSDKQSVVPVSPVNLAFPAKTFVFFELGATKVALSEAEAVKRIVDLTEDAKGVAAEKLLKGAKIFVVGDEKSAAEFVA